MTEVSLTSLKWSRSTKSTASRPRSRGRAPLEAVQQQAAVGQPGQRVVQGVVGEPFLAAPALDELGVVGVLDLAHEPPERLVGLQRLGGEESQPAVTSLLDEHREGEAGRQLAAAAASWRGSCRRW